MHAKNVPKFFVTIPSESVLNMIALAPLSSQVNQDLLANYSKGRGYPLGTTVDDILDMKGLVSLSTSKDQFIFSLMYYLGIVTHGNSKKTYTVCRIPNQIIKEEFVEKLFEIHSIDRHETPFEAVMHFSPITMFNRFAHFFMSITFYFYNPVMFRVEWKLFAKRTQDGRGCVEEFIGTNETKQGTC
jgi:hypothetical protein